MECRPRYDNADSVQDNDNLEMMTHLEGPIVDSFYDMSLCSWHNEFKPPLPSSNSPAATGGLPSFEKSSHSQMFDDNGILRDHGRMSSHKHGTLNGQNSSILADGNVMREVVGHEGEDRGAGGEARDLSTVAQDGNNVNLPEHLSTDPHYDPDIASEVTRAQSVLSPRGGESRMNAVTRHLSTYSVLLIITLLMKGRYYA